MPDVGMLCARIRSILLYLQLLFFFSQSHQFSHAGAFPYGLMTEISTFVQRERSLGLSIKRRSRF